ncbi:FG-GAP repeat protein (Fragment) [Durusdinium trenchii]|uniref:FG-GAP repeat protein n=1 Tax=Durusdinium trenchii TaxID=1381693 RepID=A0ABP0KMK4_9DINO
MSKTRPAVAALAVPALVLLSLAPAELAKSAHAQTCGPGEIFVPDVVYATPDGPNFVAIGDLNGDGDNDLAVANRDADSVSVLLNNGDGSYAPAVTYAAGDYSASVAIGDLDGDGDNDLVVGNRDSDNASVLMNNGDGTFAAGVIYPAGGGPQSVVIGDLDGDGDNDVAVANVDVDANDVTFGQSGITVLLNNGNATFAAGVPYDTGVGPLSVALGDLDGDGDLDVATANFSGDNVSILLNAGNGTFDADVRYAAGSAGSQPAAVALGDLDGDGDNDLVVTTTGGSFRDIFVLPNNGDGTLASSTLYGVDTTPVSVAVGDLDNDGDLDAAVANLNGSNVSVLLNRCGPPPVIITTQPAPVVLLPAGGGVAELSVVATGAAPLAYQWRRDGVPLADGSGVSGSTTATLTIDATLADVAVYDVVVSNATSDATSDPGVIAVRQPCPADFDSDGSLTLFDFLEFSNAFNAGCP